MSPMLPSLKRPHLWVGRSCPYCARKMGIHADGVSVLKCDKHLPQYPTRDHVMPVSRGGRNITKNIVIACRRCNEDKKAKTLSQWLAELAKRYDPRAIHVARYLAGEYDPGPDPVEAPEPVNQGGMLQKLYEHYERVDPRPKQYIRYEWTPHGLASYPVDDRAEGRGADLDDAGRRGDPAE